MRLRFVLREVAAGLRRNLGMTVSIVIVTAVSFTLVGAGILMQQQVGTLKGYWYDRVQVTVFMCTPVSDTPTCAAGAATPEQEQRVRSELDSADLSPYVEAVYVESKAQALANYRRQFGGESFARSATVEQMPLSFRVKLRDPSRSAAIVEAFTGRDGVYTVLDQTKVYGPLISGLNKATTFALGVAAVMLIAATLLVGTAVRMSAASRRRETAIMRLVGAPNALIQMPFVLEGIIAAALGAAIASGTLLIGTKYIVEGWLAPNVTGGFAFIGTAEVLGVVPFLFALGIALAALSSVVGVNRYLKI